MDCCSKPKGSVIYLKPKEDTCPFCGTKFEIINNKETCPKCNTEVVGISRITGYFSFDERFNEAKVKERLARKDHNGNNETTYNK